MHRAHWSIATSFVLLSLTVLTWPASAEEPNASARQALSEVPKQACGRQLMTDAERQSYRAAMQSVETDEERAHLRKSIHETMKVRAHERGLTLPEEPPAGPGTGRGSGCRGAHGFQHGRGRPTT